MSGLSRTIVKWLQGLDLTYPVNNPKWDLCNGFTVAEIFYWYYPQGFDLSQFNTGLSLDSRMSNWGLIKKFIVTNKLNIPIELADATMHCRDGGAILLLESMFQLLTNRPVQKAQPDFEIDLTDWPYQQKLKFHARNTVAKAIKNNVKTTELHTDPNLKLIAHKSERIVTAHVEHRQVERDADPVRFNVKKTLAEMCIQRPVPDTRKSSFQSTPGQQSSTVEFQENSSKLKPPNRNSAKEFNFDDTKSFKEIRVKQEFYDLALDR